MLFHYISDQYTGNNNQLDLYTCQVKMKHTLEIKFNICKRIRGHPKMSTFS